MTGQDKPSASVVRLRERIAAIPKWRARFLAAGLGVLSAAAFPPVYAVFLLIPAFVGWLWLTEGTADGRRAFIQGWWFGLGHFAAGLYWIANALLVFPELYAWLIPFAILGLSGGFAVFPGLVAVAVRLVPCGRMMRVLVFALAWTASEWARSWVLTGFPWNLAGTVWSFSDAAVQPAALFGTFGLGLVTVFVAALPSILGEETLGVRRAIGLVGGGAAAIIFLWAGGAVRLGEASDAMVPDVRLRLVQPNIPQHLKWRPELRDPNLVKQVQLSREPDPEGRRPTHVIWPETSATFFVTEDRERRALLAKAAPADGLVIVGAPRRSLRGQPYQVWNSLLALNPQGRIVGSYDKTHLVPFGEYIPLRSVFASIPKITEGRQDFSPGSGVTTLRLPGLPPVSPLICYEVIFPGAVAKADDRPAWILNLTNDAWYGRSSGPYQHLMATKMRAVEEGLPLVRVATTGVSAVFDAVGRRVATIGLGQAGFVDSDLPVAAAPTPYSRFGNWTVLVLAAFLSGAWTICVYGFGRRKWKRGSS